MSTRSATATTATTTRTVVVNSSGEGARIHEHAVSRLNARLAAISRPLSSFDRGVGQAGQRSGGWATFRRLLVRRLVSVALLTLVVTGVAWVGLSSSMFAGFQRRATDALFPAAPSDPAVVVVGIDSKTINAYGATPSPATVAARHRCADQGRRPGDRVRRRSTAPSSPRTRRPATRCSPRRSTGTATSCSAPRRPGSRRATSRPSPQHLTGYAAGFAGRALHAGPRAGERRPDRQHQSQPAVDRRSTRWPVRPCALARGA